jgi:hypothetical protein
VETLRARPGAPSIALDTTPYDFAAARLRWFTGPGWSLDDGTGVPIGKPHNN